MMKCKVCGKRFKPIASKRYFVQEKIVGLQRLTEAPNIYECFDCPHCGCQNAVNIMAGEIPDATAYDVDKIVAEMKSLKSGLTEWAEDEAYKLAINDAIEIVKGGGVNEH